MSQPNAYGVLEYPDGTGSNPVKRKKKKIIFLYFFYSLLYFPFLLLLYLLNITINTLSHISMVNHNTLVFLDRLL